MTTQAAWHFRTALMLLGLTSLVKLGCAAASGNESDRLALLSFKAMITQDPYEALSSWNDSLSFCEWQGVTCSRYIPRVIMLDLQARRLVGTISPWIANLTLLAWISLGDNGFYGQIPNEIGQLSRLQHINLSRNSLESEIPSNITMLSKLRELDIAYNQLFGKIPAQLGSCQKLIYIWLRSNNLTGSLPPSLGNLSSLEIVTLRYNNLKGRIPQDLGRLVQLRELLMEANSLSGTVPSSIYNLSTLVALGLSDNQLRGVLPPDLGIRLPHLQYFGVAANFFIGPLPPTLANASLLIGLEFSESKFTGHLPTNLGSLARLIQFSVAYCDLGSSDLSFLNSFTNCTNLEFLNLQGNHFKGRLPESISNLSTKLMDLRLELNEIRGFIPSGISKLASLVTFSSQNNLLTGSIPSSIGMLQKLQYLDLSSNKLLGLIPSSLGNLSHIYEINLSNNSLNGSIPWSLGDSWSLHILNLTKNNLSGAIPKHLPINLRGFIASYNSLSGPLPVEMSSMVSLLVLDVSRNQISGVIPSTIGKFMRLGQLDLSGNNFQGTIPSSLSSLKDVEFIDLSRNYFRGIIPDFLSTLPSLLHLDLSFNDFEGEVPKRGVFTNASAFFVQGNHNLCGGVSQLNLPACTIQAPAKRKISSILLAVLTTCSIVVCLILLLSVYALCYMRNSRKRISSVATKGYWKLKLTYEEIYAATDGFSQSNLVGSGWSGSVYKGKLNGEERTIAVKVLNLQKRNAYKTFLAECEALSRIRHRNILKILTCCSCVDPDGNYFLALVLKFMSNGSLEEWLHQKNLNIFQRLNIAIEVASALDYLHNHCQDAILHRDLKPSNILLDDDMSARISDFGLARILTPGGYVANSSTLSGTFGYAPPEYGLGGKASTSGDVYSYGIVLLELFTRRRPTDGMFSDDYDLHNFVKIAMPERIMEILDPLLLSTSEEIEFGINKGLVLECLIPILGIGTNCSSKSPQNRMDIKDVINELEKIRKRMSTVAPATADKK